MVAAFRVMYTLLQSLALFCACAPALTAQRQSSLDEVLEKAQSVQQSGNYRNAANLYAQATALSPGTVELWSNRGVMEFLAGDDQACLSSMRRASALDPSLFTAALFTGKAYLDLGEPARAMPFLRRAHTSRPADPEVLLSLGNAQAELHDPFAAEGFFLQAAHSNPVNAKAWYGAGVAALQSIEQNGSALSRMQPAPVWSRALLADDLFAQGRPLEASDTYRALLAQATEEQRSVLLSVLRWMLQNAQALALPAPSISALAAFSSEPQAPPAAACAEPGPTQAARCAFWANRTEDSANAAHKVLAAQPGNAEAMFWLIQSQERIAVAALSHFEELSPHSAATYLLLGNLYRLQRRPDQALGEYEKALALEPHNLAALQGSVLACLAANRAGQALTLDTTALAEDPSNPQLNLLMAEILDAQNKRVEETPFLGKAAAVPPELQPRLHYLLARAAEANGDPQTAMQQLAQALPGDKDGSIHYQLSRLFRKAGETAKAEKTLAEAKILIAQHETDAATALRDTIASPKE